MKIDIVVNKSQLMTAFLAPLPVPASIIVSLGARPSGVAWEIRESTTSRTPGRRHRASEAPSRRHRASEAPSRREPRLCGPQHQGLEGAQRQAQVTTNTSTHIHYSLSIVNYR